jgi:hypothetical protein
MVEERKVYKVLVGKPKEKDLSEDRGIDWKMGLGCILRRLAGGVWSGFSWLRIGTGGMLL